MAETTIQWTATPDAAGVTHDGFTFNPWSGCSKVAEGCRWCYAEVNYSVKIRGVKWGANGNRVLASDSMWKQPLAWNRKAAAAGVRLKVFCASLADVFEDWPGPITHHQGGRVKLSPKGRYGPEDNIYPNRDLTAEWRFVTLDDCRRRLFALIDATPHLDWLLLTKRPENVRRMMPFRAKPFDAPYDGGKSIGEMMAQSMLYRPNVWLGTSIATQADANRNIPELLKCRDLSPVLFVSAEPLIEAVDLSRWTQREGPEWRYHDGVGYSPLDWLIIGGESGPHARPCDVAWIRSLKDQCAAAGVPCFVKQLGSEPRPSFPPSDNAVRYIKDSKGGDWDEWPTDLRVREFPDVKVTA